MNEVCRVSEDHLKVSGDAGGDAQRDSEIQRQAPQLEPELNIKSTSHPISTEAFEQ